MLIFALLREPTPSSNPHQRRMCYRPPDDLWDMYMKDIATYLGRIRKSFGRDRQAPKFKIKRLSIVLVYHLKTSV
jgi:hypothetical protein